MGAASRGLSISADSFQKPEPAYTRAATLCQRELLHPHAAILDRKPKSRGNRGRRDRRPALTDLGGSERPGSADQARGDFEMAASILCRHRRKHRGLGLDSAVPGSHHHAVRRPVSGGGVVGLGRFPLDPTHRSGAASRRCGRRLIGRQPTMSASVKNWAISSLALSVLSEPCTEFSPTFRANSLRIVPSAACSGLVAPITSR